MATVVWNQEAAATLSLAGLPTPRAAFHNSRLMWQGLTVKEFPSPPYAPPGGVSFRPDGTVYFPQGNDWGRFLAAARRLPVR
jgi:hypothetical protein